MKITVFTASTCPFSRQEKEFLASHNLAYTEFSVDSQPENMARMLDESEGFSAVPFTIIEKEEGKKEKVKGFDRTKLCLLLDVREEEKATDSVDKVDKTETQTGEFFNVLGDIGKNQAEPALTLTADEPLTANPAPAEAPAPLSSFEQAEPQGAEGAPAGSGDNLPAQDLKPAQSIDQPFGMSVENDSLDLNAKPPRYEVQEVNPLAAGSSA